MEHVNAAYESIVGSPLQYERKTYLDGLQEAKRSVTKQEKALTVTHTMPFNKYKVFFGFLKSYVTIYIFGHAPHEFPAWNALQMLVLYPVTVYRWAKLKWLVFFTEFCWVSNLFLAGYCITLHIRPALVPPEHRTTMTHFFFAVAAGPLQAAVVLLGNALVPHSPDHMMSLLIHLQPAMTAYCLRWLLCVKINFYGAFALTSTPSTRRLLDGVKMPVPHRSTEPGRTRHRREMT